MKLPRRKFLIWQQAQLPTASPVSGRQKAQAFPTRPFTSISSGYAAGGATDINARLRVNGCSERLGQSFIFFFIENRPGAGAILPRSGRAFAA